MTLTSEDVCVAESDRDQADRTTRGLALSPAAPHNEGHVDDITVLVLDDSAPTADTKGGLASPPTEAVIRRMPVQVLSSTMHSFVASVSNAFQNLVVAGQFPLKEVELQVEFTASGGITLIGTARAEGRGAITLKFGK